MKCISLSYKHFSTSTKNHILQFLNIIFLFFLHIEYQGNHLINNKIHSLLYSLYKDNVSQNERPKVIDTPVTLVNDYGLNYHNLEFCVNFLLALILNYLQVKVLYPFSHRSLLKQISLSKLKKDTHKHTATTTEIWPSAPTSVPQIYEWHKTQSQPIMHRQ